MFFCFSALFLKQGSHYLSLHVCHVCFLVTDNPLWFEEKCVTLIQGFGYLLIHSAGVWAGRRDDVRAEAGGDPGRVWARDAGGRLWGTCRDSCHLTPHSVETSTPYWESRSEAFPRRDYFSTLVAAVCRELGRGDPSALKEGRRAGVRCQYGGSRCRRPPRPGRCSASPGVHQQALPHAPCSAHAHKHPVEPAVLKSHCNPLAEIKPQLGRTRGWGGVVRGADSGRRKLHETSG